MRNAVVNKFWQSHIFISNFIKIVNKLLIIQEFALKKLRCRKFA